MRRCAGRFRERRGRRDTTHARAHWGSVPSASSFAKKDVLPVYSHGGCQGERRAPLPVQLQPLLLQPLLQLLPQPLPQPLQRAPARTRTRPRRPSVCSRVPRLCAPAP